MPLMCWHLLLGLLLHGFESQSGTNENGCWEGPLHRRCPNDPNRTSVEDQLKIAELRLDKNRKKKNKKTTILSDVVRWAFICCSNGSAYWWAFIREYLTIFIIYRRPICNGQIPRDGLTSKIYFFKS